jgi:adenosylmethionine-8-amino-7-oxononanoate aminotransferase
LEISHIEPCYAYRGRREGESEEDYGLRVANTLEAEILRLGPENVAGFIAETVGGATAGVITPAPGYFRRIREICDQYGILLILDEVMCGMGRTGTLYACEQEGIAPDIVTCAKGLGGGYQPIGATIMAEKVINAILEGPDKFQHGFTYVGHPTATAAALAVQQVIERDGLLSRVQEMGARLIEGLKERFGQHPAVGDIRGRGLFIGVELVADRETKTPFDPALKLNAKIKAQAMEEGMICYPGGGTADGERGDHILLAPPFIIEDAQVIELIDKLERSINGALEQVQA